MLGSRLETLQTIPRCWWTGGFNRYSEYVLEFSEEQIQSLVNLLNAPGISYSQDE